MISDRVTAAKWNNKVARHQQQTAAGTSAERWRWWWYRRNAQVFIQC